VNRYSAAPNGTLVIVREQIDTHTMLQGMPLTLQTVEGDQVRVSSA
jgi:hypothetical protein